MALRRFFGNASGILGLCLLAGVAHADWREGRGTFRIGMVAPAGETDTAAFAAAVETAYSRALGLPVELFLARNYATLVDAQASARVDYAVYSAAAYAAAHRFCGCVEPVAAPLGADGSKGIRSVLIARTGRFGSAADLAGGRIAMPEDDSFAGRIAPLAGFQPLSGPDTAERDDFVLRTQTASDAERLFLDGAVDGLFGWEAAPAEEGREPSAGTAKRLVEAGADAEDLVVLWRSGLLRNGPHAIRKDYPAEARTLIVAFLKGLRDTDIEIYERLSPRDDGGFAEARHEDYAPVIEAIDALADRPADAGGGG